MPQKLSTSLLRQLNRSAVVDLIRREGPISSSALGARLDLSPATVKRVSDSLLAEELVAYDGYDETTRGRPSARFRFRGDKHAIIGVEAAQHEFYGAISDLNGRILTELSAKVPDDDPKRNLDRLFKLIDRLLAAPRPPGKSVRGIGIGVPSIVKQPAGEVVLSLGLGWQDLQLRNILQKRFELPVFVENALNLSALGEWGFGKGQGHSSVVSLQIGPGGGAGIVVDGKLLQGRADAAGELAWFLDDPLLTGREFKHLGDKQSLRFGPYIPEKAFTQLADASARYANGKLALDEHGALRAPAAVTEVLDYATMAVAMIAAVLNPDVVILSGEIARGAPLMLDALNARLKGNVYDPPDLHFTDLGHRNVVMGAIMQVLDATTLNPR